MVMGLKILRKFIYSMEASPKFRQRLCKKMVLRFEESMRLRLDSKWGRYKQIHTLLGWLNLSFWELNIWWSFILQMRCEES